MKFNPDSGRRDRPEFSKEYGVDTTNLDGFLSWDWVCKKLTESRNYWIASTRTNGKPHVAPVWGLFFREVIFFATNAASQKARNLTTNPAVSVHLESGDDTVIVEGQADPVSDKELLEELSIVYGQKYESYQPPPDFGPGAVVFAVKPQTVFAWKEADFINTPTRWQFD